MTSRHIPRIADWRIADGVRVEELDGTWLALDAAGGVVYRLEALAAEAVRHVAHRMPLPARLVPAARELAGHGVLEHPLVDRRTALVGAGVVTLTGLAATLLPAASAAASTLTQWTSPGGTGGTWPVEGGTFTTETVGEVGEEETYYFHAFTTAGTSTLNVLDPAAVTDVSVLIVGGGAGGGLGKEGCGGGGGAGAVMLASGILPQGNLTIVVGAGGLGKPGDGTSGRGGSGNPSRFGDFGDPIAISVNGGGPGGGAVDLPGLTGGCGGGAGADNDKTGNGGGVLHLTSESDAVTALSDSVVTGSATLRGFAGGASFGPVASANRRAGGGGGAGSAGITGASGVPGDGGASFDFSSAGFGSFGVAGRFAGGGGGAGGRASVSSAAGLGGGSDDPTAKGGAGDGGYGGGVSTFFDYNSGGDAVANTGSGGGGGVNRKNVDEGFTAPNPRAGNGGSGVVIVRYRLAP